jgi:hypothetical protein
MNGSSAITQATQPANSAAQALEIGSAARPGVDAGTVADPLRFSLVNGGPLFQLWRRTGLAGDDMQLPLRRILFTVAVIWLPLLLLTAIDGRAWGDSVVVPFFRDVETHVRMLIAVPLLILAEVRVHRELPSILHCFVDRGLISAAARPRFDAAVASAIRWRNSVAAELLLIVLVYAVGILVIRRTQFVLDAETWYATSVDGHMRLTYAGWWGAFVAMPVVQFLCVRWFFRLGVWGRFLWQVSRIPMNLEPAHPDCTAGLHFIALTERACWTLMLGMGAVLSGMIANKILYTGATLFDFKVEIVGMVALLSFLVFGPMLAFTPKLLQVKHHGVAEYGRLGQRYAREFDRKWIRSEHPAEEPLLGSADIQSLADLRNSFVVVKDIRWTPFDVWDVATLTTFTLIPLAPLLLTAFSVEEILDRLLKTIF